MEFTLTFSENEVNIILGGLAELPAKHSIELIGKIKTQCEDLIAKENETNDKSKITL